MPASDRQPSERSRAKKKRGRKRLRSWERKMNVGDETQGLGTGILFNDHRVFGSV